jgi:hypothetical protein
MCPATPSRWRSSAAIRRATGRWAIFWGPLGNETRAWLDFLSTGRPSIHATPEQAMLNLKTTYAIERAVSTGQVIRLDHDS